MSQEIALEFRRKFGQVELLKQQGKKITEIAYIRDNQRCILYIINKETYSQKPPYKSMFYFLKNLRNFCEANNIDKLLLPKISSGRDRLNWEKVRTMLRYIFKNIKIKIVIYNIKYYSQEEKHNIIDEFHSSPLGGHQGVSRTIKRIKMHHSWKGIKNDVISCITSCSS